MDDKVEQTQNEYRIRFFDAPPLGRVAEMWVGQEQFRGHGRNDFNAALDMIDTLAEALVEERATYSD